MRSNRSEKMLERTERVLAKGDMMTWNEVLYLRDRGLLIKDIAEVCGIPRATFDRQLKDWKKEMGI